MTPESKPVQETGVLYELRRTLSLAVPITAGHLSNMILGFVDTLMIGRVGVVPLAGAAFANAVSNVFFIAGIGLLTAVQVFVSHAHGAGKKEEAGEVLRRGLVIAGGMGLSIFLVLWGGFPLLSYLGQSAEVVEASKSYLWFLAFSMPFILPTIALKNYSEAQDAPWPGLWTGLISVLLNIFLNWVFIYGNLGSPALGLSGAGLATFLSRVVNLLLIVAWLKQDAEIRKSWPQRWLAPLSMRPLIAMLRLGFPVSLQLVMEIGAFAAAALLMGNLGIVEIASHQIALTYAATTFMIPMGISLAVGIRVGQVIGAGQFERARRIGFSAMAFGICLSAVFAALYLFLNKPLVGLFTDDRETVLMAAGLLVIAGFFQLFDATQVLAIGALRGCKDVKIPTAIAFTAYWIIAIPGGALLAFVFGFGAQGIWLGLAAGLGTAAIGLALRFHVVTRKL